MIRLGDIGSYIRGLTYSSNDVVEQNGTFIMRSNNIVNGCSLDYYNDVVSVNKRISKEQMLQNGVTLSFVWQMVVLPWLVNLLFTMENAQDL